MRRALLNKLVCPITGRAFQLHTIESDLAEDGEVVCRTGVLWHEGGYWYPVINFVPIMLIFRTRLTDKFSRRFSSVIDTLPSTLMAPARRPEKGELSIQKTFTEEWGGLGDDSLSFAYDEDELLVLHRDVWIQMDETERSTKESVLDVGCGFGKEAVILSQLFKAAFVVAIDMNLALVSAGERLVRMTRVNPVVSSLFHMPFPNGVFSHVHCQGVMHHTFSTKAAFDVVRTKVACDGSFFVWLYAKEDRHVVPGVRGIFVWVYWTVSHSIFRPILSRSPASFRNLIVHLISFALHPILKRRNHRGKERWRYKNTVHGIRDAFTPRYAHEHGFNEVLIWFEDAGFAPTIQLPAVYRDLFESRLVGVGVLGRSKAN
jgi:SAM-dependent methyltransferase